MKKTLSLILVLALGLAMTLSLASCKINKKKDIYEQAAELAPTTVTTLVEYTTKSGDKLEGEYVLQSEGEDSIFTYTFDRYRTSAEAIEDGKSDTIKTVSGVIYYQYGEYSMDGEDWNTAPVPANIKLNLVASKLTGAVITADGKTLTATVAPENAASVLGSDLSCDGAISIKVVSNGTYITALTITCTTKEGAELFIRTSYSYNKIELEFPA